MDRVDGDVGLGDQLLVVVRLQIPDVDHAALVAYDQLCLEHTRRQPCCSTLQILISHSLAYSKQYIGASLIIPGKRKRTNSYTFLTQKLIMHFDNLYLKHFCTCY